MTDEQAIAEMKETFELQKAAFAGNPYPSLDERLAVLKTLKDMMFTYRTEIQEALKADFHTRPNQLTDLLETFAVISRVDYTSENLAGWMADIHREIDEGLFGTSKAYIRYQPKGVLGSIIPWNFPFDVGLGPAIEMLAAGNRVMLKMSEFSPVSSELMKVMVEKFFDRDQLAVVTGGTEVSKVFAALQWDHLMYTGGGVVGREVMVAAAKNLVPVTLELGGKNPVIVDEDSIDESIIVNVLASKILNNGQICVSPDYCLVPEGQDKAFAGLIKQYFENTLPDYAQGGHIAGIINERHFDRLTQYVEDARNKGAEIIELGGTADRSTRGMPFTLILNPTEEMDVLKHEIFGPLFAIKTYKTMDDAISFVNIMDQPLGVYVFSKTRANIDKIVANTKSGGVSVNYSALHSTMMSLPFGGIGKSGCGRHHSQDGFNTFSNQRSIGELGDGGILQEILPPYGQTVDDILTMIFSESE